jgi:hypothetical protein
VLVLGLLLVLDLLAIHPDKRARSFGNCSVPVSVAAERLFLDYEHEHEHDSPSFGIWVRSHAHE